VRAGHPDIYVHRSAVESRRLPRPGDLVEFGVEESNRGPVAKAVLVVEAAVPSSKP
jgi:cold shock CspA family protein